MKVHCIATQTLTLQTTYTCSYNCTRESKVQQPQLPTVLLQCRIRSNILHDHSIPITQLTICYKTNDINHTIRPGHEVSKLLSNV